MGTRESRSGPKARKPVTDKKLEERLFQALYRLDIRVFILAIIIRFTGFRIGDVLPLTKADITGKFIEIEERKTLYLKERNKIKAQKRNAKARPGKPARKVEKHADLDYVLGEYTKYMENDQLLAESSRRSRKGNPISYKQATRILLKAAKEVGIPTEEFGWHSLRKMCFTAVYEENGCDISTAQHFSGHKNPNDLSLYIRTTERTNAEISRTLKSPITEIVRYKKRGI